ncbi:uncharacterized protein K460DRAFT_70252 [Cucurbitaria berberidis CBS 394.84]|uniref:Uncharacterized protein n=1 Tax=Cucurbitaria berberidis CBS 394.84 TaxID=1168544 RepID=A0A9P4LAQ3_9PLEO|nr:uncharacterized protein K460DRAFT_70252 [Cucurbitaria berberidis CBS 394.84]KAF1848270.1 hypothetical protein K460DRAFT_70252 [Cucurbitaria berberidis CBS 394.84]
MIDGWMDGWIDRWIDRKLPCRRQEDAAAQCAGWLTTTTTTTTTTQALQPPGPGLMACEASFAQASCRPSLNRVGGEGGTLYSPLCRSIRFSTLSRLGLVPSLCSLLSLALALALSRLYTTSSDYTTHSLRAPASPPGPSSSRVCHLCVLLASCSSCRPIHSSTSFAPLLACPGPFVCTAHLRN